MNIQQIQNASAINDLHEKARSSAADAVRYGAEAGALLLEVKAQLAHGQFLRWVKQNLDVSERQAQRYMAHASGKLRSVRDLFEKYDGVSHLERMTPNREESAGLWVGDRWEPEPGFEYSIHEVETGTYWVQPAVGGETHVCRHYRGQRLSAENFFWRYTILSVVHDPESTAEFYVGTRFAPLSRSGIHEILTSYGLRDLRGATIIGFKADSERARPQGEPDPDYWYWDAPKPEGGLWGACVKMGHVTKAGIPTIRGGL